MPYENNGCKFISSKKVRPTKSHKIDYFYISLPKFGEKTYNKWVNVNKANKLILGPNFVPGKWFLFPNNVDWKEKRFSEIIKTIKGIAIHTNRVKNHLAKKSNSTNLIKKYKIIRQCTNLKPKNIKKFEERKIDILFFEKYADLNRTKQANHLIRLLHKKTKKIKILKYGYYNRKEMKELANNSKFIIYFSFYDCGPIGLIEILNHGTILFTHQKEFIIDKNIGFYIPELDKENHMESAYKKIMRKIEIINKLKPNTYLIAKKNQDNYKCENALDDLCKSLKTI